MHTPNGTDPEEQTSATTNVHGVLVDVFGVGVLLMGKSGLGKSECALDLVLRGHRLVADDLVIVSRKNPNLLYGTSSALLKNHLEIRGLGILNVQDLFGVAATRDKKLIEIVVELTEWDPKAEYDRLGIDEQTYKLLEIEIPYIKLPVSPGRNITTLIEVAARNHLLKAKGFYSSRNFQNRLDQKIIENNHASAQIQPENNGAKK